MTKRQFLIDIGYEKIPVEGQIHKNVALKYLMKRRRSLLMTRNPQKVESLYAQLPQEITIIGKSVTKTYYLNWQRQGSEQFQGSRFTFEMASERITKVNN
ncbi:MAG: hypothetical protein ACTHKP_06155 [Nitrososphaeraceae archaeon]